MTAYDENTWYPSCVVKLTLRFDEALHVAGSGDKTAFDEIVAMSTTAAAQNSVPKRAAIPATPTVAQGVQKFIDDINGKKRARPSVNKSKIAPGKVTDKNLAAFAGARASSSDNGALAQSDIVALPPGSTLTKQGSQYVPADGSQVTSSTGPVQLAAGGLGISPLTYGTDGFTVIANRVPTKGSFKLPHPRQASTFSLSFDYQEFPIDPRLLIAVGVEIHLGAVSAEDYASGMAGKKDTDGRPLSILKTTSAIVDPFSGRPSFNAETLLFFGTVDTWEVDHTDNGSTITLEGRDIRSIFLNAKIPPAKVGKINLKQPIDRVVQDIIQTMGVEQDLRLVVMTDVNEWPNGIVPSPGDIDGMTRVRLGAAGDKPTSTPANGSKANYWDLITNYCTIVGAMPMMYGAALWIRPNHSIFDIVNPPSGVARSLLQSFGIVDRNPTIPAPFADGQPRKSGDEEFRVRRFVYGRDIKRLKLARKFAGAVVPMIKTVSFDDRVQGINRLIFGQWPPKGSAQAALKPETEAITVPLYGIRSVESLNQAARGIFEEIGRGETGGECETGNLASFGGSNTDPDVLRARPLEPVEFVVDVRSLKSLSPLVSEFTDNERRSFSEEVDVLHDRIGDRAIARALVALARGAVRELLAYYQVIDVNFDWDSSSGVKTVLGFQNYIVPRSLVKNEARQPASLRGTQVNVTGSHQKSKVFSAIERVEQRISNAVKARTPSPNKSSGTEAAVKRPRSVDPRLQ